VLVDWVGGGGGAAACTLTLLFSPCTFLVAHQGSEVEAGIEMVLEGGGGLDTGGALVLGGGGGASVVNVFTSLKAASTPPCLSMKS